MKTTSFTSPRYAIVVNAMLMFVLALLVSNCASNNKGSSKLKIKTKPNAYQERTVQSPNVSIEKNLVERDFQGKVRNTLTGYQFNTKIWGSSCDCR